MDDQIIVQANASDWDAPTFQMRRLYGGSIISSPSSHNSLSGNDDDSFDSTTLGCPVLDEDIQPLSDIIFSSSELTIEDNLKYPEILRSHMKIEKTTVSDALLAGIKKLRNEREPSPTPRSLTSIISRQRPNCLFLNHMGSRTRPAKASSTSSTMAAVESVLDIDNDADFLDCIPESPVATTSASEATFDIPSTIRYPTACTPSPAPAESPSRSLSFKMTSSSRRLGPDDVPTEAPQDFPLLDDFIGMPNDIFALDSPTENALAMDPGLPVGPPTDSPACFPSESPSHRCQVIDVGPPTDLVYLPPAMEMEYDPEAMGIGAAVNPEILATEPRIAMRANPKNKTNKDVAVLRRRARPTAYYHVRRASICAYSTTNTLEAQYYRQAAPRRRLPRVVPSPPFTDPRMPQPRPSKALRPGHSYQGRHHPYRRRSFGLAPMPYAHPPIVSPPTRRTYASLPAYPVPPTLMTRPRPPIRPRPQHSHHHSWQG